MKKWRAMPLGLIIFLLFNKYLGILSVLESKRHLTYAGHLSALMGNSSLLSEVRAQRIRLILMLPPVVAVTSLGGKKNSECFSGCNVFKLATIITREDNW